MGNSLVEQQLITNFFVYYPKGGALYDSDGLLIALNKYYRKYEKYTSVFI